MTRRTTTIELIAISQIADLIRWKGGKLSKAELLEELRINVLEALPIEVAIEFHARTTHHKNELPSCPNENANGAESASSPAAAPSNTAQENASAMII